MRRKKLHISLTLLSYLLSGGLGGSGTLCIGADGHVEVESENGCCSAESTMPIGEDTPCGACLDIPLLHEHIPSTGIKAQFSSMASSTPPAFSSLLVINFDASATTVRREVYRIDPGEISSSHLQCTILLC